jgi:hypothetical protein
LPSRVTMRMAHWTQPLSQWQDNNRFSWPGCGAWAVLIQPDGKSWSQSARFRSLPFSVTSNWSVTIQTERSTPPLALAAS